ncbi:MAG: hypothetical protein K0S23_1062 [Fluviicola sp.]|jgi:hypothetical protein|uniref:hypothetical protein n=1 Tax=Fluviicola sp. TaxID=1917219 RepID=UPI0026204B99|nr:hypothetical protein [Fluviicola sp.]MDF3026755.1 hypothetical protein [Fluviicola sp.]
MSTTEIIQTYTVQPVMMPIIPTTGDPLTDTFNVDAAYSNTTGYLTVVLSFMIPTELQADQVTVKQYYNSGGRSKRLEFYLVYDCESTGTYKQVNCQFKASAVDGAGSPIDLGGILNVFTMVVCLAGPKTSRGTVSSVRTTEV